MNGFTANFCYMNAVFPALITNVSQQMKSEKPKQDEQDKLNKLIRNKNTDSVYKSNMVGQSEWRMNMKKINAWK